MVSSGLLLGSFTRNETLESLLMQWYVLYVKSYNQNLSVKGRGLPNAIVYSSRATAKQYVTKQ